MTDGESSQRILRFLAAATPVGVGLGVGAAVITEDTAREAQETIYVDSPWVTLALHLLIAAMIVYAARGGFPRP